MVSVAPSTGAPLSPAGGGGGGGGRQGSRAVIIPYYPISMNNGNNSEWSEQGFDGDEQGLITFLLPGPLRLLEPADALSSLHRPGSQGGCGLLEDHYPPTEGSHIA